MESNNLFLHTGTEPNRKASLQMANAISNIEGVPVSAFASELYSNWANYKITGEQMKFLLIEKAKKMGEITNG